MVRRVSNVISHTALPLPRTEGGGHCPKVHCDLRHAAVPLGCKDAF